MQTSSILASIAQFDFTYEALYDSDEVFVAFITTTIIGVASSGIIDNEEITTTC